MFMDYNFKEVEKKWKKCRSAGHVSGCGIQRSCRTDETGERAAPGRRYGLSSSVGSSIRRSFPARPAVRSSINSQSRSVRAA